MSINSLLTAASAAGQLLARSLILLGGIFLPLLASAEVPASISDPIVKQLKAARADLDYQVLSPAPLDGFYEVQVEGAFQAILDAAPTKEPDGVMVTGLKALLEA